MHLSKSLMLAGHHQLKNVRRLASGGPLTLPSLISTTLDQDDVELAKHWLKQRQNWYRLEEVEEYNNAFASWNESSFAFSFMGGRVALSAIIYALGLQPGDEVILPGYTCVVVPNAFRYAGIEIVYSDIELGTYGLDASLLEKKITSKTKAILLHHLYGLVCRDYEETISIARQNNLYVIEDCAHSTGAMYKGKRVGNLGDVAFFSSEHSKVFTTIQGGVAVTNNQKIASRIEQYTRQANFPVEDRIDQLLHSVTLDYFRYKHPQRWWRGDVISLLLGHKQLVSTTKQEEKGERPAHYGCKMPAPVAALGINQLKKIDVYNEGRRQVAKRWDSWCEENHYRKPQVIPESVPVFLRYPVLVEPEKKQDRSWATRDLGIDLGIWFVSNVHPGSWTVKDCPNADKAVKQCVNFPGILN